MPMYKYTVDYQVNGPKGPLVFGDISLEGDSPLTVDEVKALRARVLRHIKKSTPIGARCAWP